MPVIKSAVKKMRQDLKRRATNRLKKEKLKALIKTAEKTPTEKNIKTAISFIDRVAKPNLIHKNKAARLKSRLSKLLTKNEARPKPRQGKASTSKRKVLSARVKRISPLKKSS